MLPVAYSYSAILRYFPLNAIHHYAQIRSTKRAKTEQNIKSSQEMKKAQNVIPLIFLWSVINTLYKYIPKAAVRIIPVNA